MEGLFRKEGSPLVLDATHPYASVVSENIHEACRKADCRYLRLIRSSGQPGWGRKHSGDRKRGGGGGLASRREGRILVTTGSKELSKFTALPDYQERVTARVLATPEVVRQCVELGFPGRNLICMQGPFSKEMNLAMLRQTGAAYLVTKESGRAGGFPEKLAAAKEAGVQVVLIRRPAEQEGMSVKRECAS